MVDRPARAELAPYSALIPPGLVVASVAYLRDLDAMGERVGNVKAAPAKLLSRLLPRAQIPTPLPRETARVVGSLPDRRGRLRPPRRASSHES